jgi:subtilisin family serine protease
MSDHNTNTRPVPPNYYYLWHLAALGIIDADFGPAPAAIPPNEASAVRNEPGPVISGTVWDQIASAGPVSPARVALIDVGVAPQHPNLVTRVDAEASIDLTTHRYGARYLAVADDADPYRPEGREAFFAGLDISGLGNLNLMPADKTYLDQMVDELESGEGALRTLINPEDLFAAHGTSCASLIVGEPAAVADGDDDNVSLPPESAFDEASDAVTPSRNKNLLPYFGADPYSRLVSIRTSFEEDAWQFIAAFLYAYHTQCDVIVIPRGLPDPVRTPFLPKDDLKADLENLRNQEAADLFARIEQASQYPDEIDPNAIQQGANPNRAWNILAAVVVAVSKKIPVICAAGNSGESQLIYPSNLAADDNGIIAVGAVTAEGFRAGYSNYGDGLTLVAPSDDSEVFNRHQLRVDRVSPFAESHLYDAGAGKEYRYSEFSLLAADIPGAFGYSSGTDPWSSILPPGDNPGEGGGYYTSFGGTSGACALVGGVAALVQRAHKAANGAGARLDGAAVKGILADACHNDALVAPGYRPLTPDCMNTDNEDMANKSYFFGAGLLDASKAVVSALAL